MSVQVMKINGIWTVNLHRADLAFIVKHGERDQVVRFGKKLARFLGCEMRCSE